MQPTYLVEIKYQIQLAHISEEAIQHLNEEMYSLQICQFIIIRIYTCAKKQACISSVNNLIIPKLDEIRLVLLVARSH